FRKLWSMHDVRPKGLGSALIDHPQVGLLELAVEMPLPVPAD
ncbi:MAG: hypothetical protein QOF98_2711, partial [Streptomyces sp.]|nr:hypothetical protein [Streptomyces sp.]